VVAFGTAWSVRAEEPAQAADKGCPAMAGAKTCCAAAGAAAPHGKVSREDFVKRHQAEFKKLDKDGDGKLTKEEFLTGRVDVFTAIDANGDTVVTVDELAAYYIHPACKPDACQNLPKAKSTDKICFDNMDADGDGVLVIEERVSFCKARAAAMDKDGDGKISRAEFTADAERRFAGKDANQDGVVTEEEYILWLAGPAPTPVPAP
jgi:Ca2+-binding EF-hand superfamily protein